MANQVSCGGSGDDEDGKKKIYRHFRAKLEVNFSSFYSPPPQKEKMTGETNNSLNVVDTFLRSLLKNKTNWIKWAKVKSWENLNWVRWKWLWRRRHTAHWRFSQCYTINPSVFQICSINYVVTIMSAHFMVDSPVKGESIDCWYITNGTYCIIPWSSLDMDSIQWTRKICGITTMLDAV